MAIFVQSFCCALVVASSCNMAAAFEWGWGSSDANRQHATEELDGSNFDTFIREHSVTAVLFYAPWCFYSQQVMPSWDLAGQKMQIHDPPVALVKIDTSRHTAVGDKYNIRAFPTLKLFVDGHVHDYEQQGRDWQQIVRWINRHIDRDHVLKSKQDADDFLHDNDLNVIGLFEDGVDSSFFTRLARDFEDVSFAESRETAASSEIAEVLSKHASLVCETIDVGTSEDNEKTVDLPREGMECTGQPRNPQRPEWTDRYRATVKDKQAIVNRDDDSSGWLQMLQIRCCDKEEEHNTKLHDVPVPSIVMFLPHDERFARFEGDLGDSKALEKWVSMYRAPMVMKADSETVQKIMQGDANMPMLMLFEDSVGGSLEPIVREAAKSLRGRVLVCFSGTTSQTERRFMELAAVDEDSLPAVALLKQDSSGAKKFRITKSPKTITSHDVVQFIDDFEADKLRPAIKSEAEPSEEDVRATPVTVLVGNTFYGRAHDKDQDVLVNLYAPWCGHCRKFEPQYKELAKNLKHVKTLVIAKMDATRNEVEGMQVQGFPTVALFPAGSSPKTPIMYHGNRQPADIIRWLHSNCVHSFSEAAPKEATTAAPESGLLDPSEEDL